MDTCFKIDDMTYAGILAQSLLAAWDNTVDNLLRNINNKMFSVVLFQHDLKDEYYRKMGRTYNEALISAHKSKEAAPKKKKLSDRISNLVVTNNKLFCNMCKKHNHATHDC
jgi:phosphoribosylcarboxyaminoimidazole (NCAIR) mutase